MSRTTKGVAALAISAGLLLPAANHAVSDSTDAAVAVAGTVVGIVAGREDAAFIMTVGADTFGVETFSRTADSLTGQIVGRQLGRLEYSAALTPQALVARWEMRAWLPNAGAATPPAQTAEFTFRGDSVIATLTAGGSTQVQRFQTETGALPNYPTSIALLEQVVRRARVLAGADIETGKGIDVPLFALAGAQTIHATLTRVGPDSVTIAVGGVAVRLQVDDAGRVLGGAIPAQNLVITRVARGMGEEALGSLGEMAPDYSAPPGAPYTAEEVTVPVPAVRADDGAASGGAPGSTRGRNTSPGATANPPSPGHTLAGTLTLPRDRTGPVPAVVTITGSGPQRRDEDVVPGYAIFRQVADALGRAGIAVLRLDDRGIGSSTGDFTTATTADFVDDIRAALDFLRTRPEIDPHRLVLLGHSEGGLVAPMVAATDEDLAALVLLAAPAESGREIIAYQQRYLIAADTMIRTAAARDSALAVASRQLDLSASSSPWLEFFLDYDPLPTAARVRQPVLILHGATDRQVTADQAERLAAAIRGSGNARVEVHIFPDLDHLFLHDPDGNPLRYAALPSKEVPAAVLTTIAKWLNKTLPTRPS